MSFRKILCPVDLSAPSADAARYAAALAAQSNGELTLLHVAPAVDFDFSMVAPASSKLLEATTQRNQAIRQALDIFPGEPGLAISPQRVTAEGDAAEHIVAYAKQGGYDLIVMSTHGSGAVRRWLLVGSVTTKVLHLSEIPVLAATDFGGRFQHHNIRKLVRRIVAAIDMGPECKRVLCAATGLARENGASLTVVHAAPPMGEHAKDFFDDEWRRTLDARIRGKIGEMLKEAGVEGEVIVECGDAAEIVGKAASRGDADLTIIGRSTHRGLIGKLRAQAYEIIRHSPCPVLSV